MATARTGSDVWVGKLLEGYGEENIVFHLNKSFAAVNTATTAWKMTTVAVN